MLATKDDPLLVGLLTSLRRTLHSCPETAGNEVLTSGVIANFLEAYKPDALRRNIGGHGLAAEYWGRRDGPTVMVRCELDALAIEDEPEGRPFGGAAHRCGHDGHMAMVAGLAPRLFVERPPAGRVVLLFQPSEETGSGARDVINDPEFGGFKPDYAVALHNLPGVPSGLVVARRGVFAGASVGMCVSFHGAPSHAAEPEKGLSPTPAMATLLQEFKELNNYDDGDDFQLLTITHVEIGRESFGLTPGAGKLRATLRARTEEKLFALRAHVAGRIRHVAEITGLGVDILWVEEFPDTRSDDELVDVLEEGCKENAVDFHLEKVPFRWSEDFGHFAKACPSLYFGLGIGEDRPNLHSRDYAFPDECIAVGMRIFHRLVTDLTDPARR